MLVSQLQGLKGVNMKGFNLADYLLTCAEEMAVVFGAFSVKVQLASRNYYYDLDDTHRLYPQLYAHQRRLYRVYNDTPKKRGYGLTADHHWHEKHLI